MPGVFAWEELELMAGRVLRLLGEVGYLVSHGELAGMLTARGLKASASGRLLFAPELVREFVAFQKVNAAKYSRAAQPPSALGPRRDYATGLGNMPSKFYDHAAGGPRVGTRECLEAIARFAHAEERVGSLSLPLSLTDVPAETSPIEAFLTMARITDKAVCSLEPFSGELVPYVAELAEVFGAPPNVPHGIGSCICINPILKLEERSAGVMLAKARYGVTSLVTSMPCAGGNAPVALDGAVVQATAEIVGGLVISWLIEPELNHRGYISSGNMDFRTATLTQSSPDSVLIDCGVVELMEHAFGGNTAVGGRTYVAARKPGLQAVYEKTFKTIAYQRLRGDMVYGGLGILDNGALFSPEQFVIDMEVDASLRALARGPAMGDGVVDAIREVVESGRADFMSHEHTLANFRESFWEPSVFLRAGVSEADAVERAHGRFRELVDAYRPCAVDEDKLRRGAEILARAKSALGAN
jgi:trimethylamine:corrinoid methyltransferase-like protein